MSSARIVVAGHYHIRQGLLIDTRLGCTRDEQSRYSANWALPYTLEDYILQLPVAEGAALRIAADCTRTELETPRRGLGTDVDNPTMLNHETMLDWVATVANYPRRTVIVSNPSCSARCWRWCSHILRSHHVRPALDTQQCPLISSLVPVHSQKNPYHLPDRNWELDGYAGPVGCHKRIGSRTGMPAGQASCWIAHSRLNDRSGNVTWLRCRINRVRQSNLQIRMAHVSSRR